MIHLQSVRRVLSFVAAVTIALPGLARAQEPAAPATTQEAHKVPTPAEVIMPHITDSKQIEFPCFKTWEEWNCEYELPTWNVTIGRTVIDMGPTKHVVFLAFAGALCILMLVLVARAHTRQSRATGSPKGFAAGIEGLMLLLRDKIYIPVLGGPGHGAEKFIPFSLTIFFFVAFCNLIGLMPWGSTPTGNLGVTAVLAIITFFTVEIVGMRTLGKGYIKTVVFWPHDMALPMKAVLTLIMTPVEIVGKFTKPFTLTIRLFANMVAGHVIILSLIALMLLFGAYAIPGLVLAMGIFALELLIAFIQAFIFSLLASVYIGQIRSAHH